MKICDLLDFFRNSTLMDNCIVASTPRSCVPHAPCVYLTTARFERGLLSRTILTSLFLCTLFLSVSGCDSAPPKVKAQVQKKETTTELEPPKTDKTPSSQSEEKNLKSSSLRIGVLDFNKVWHDAKAPQHIRDGIQKKRRQYQKEIIKLEEKLRHQEVSLQAEHDKLSAEEYQERRKKFESEVLAVQKQAQAHKQRLEKSYTFAMGQVSETLNKIIEQIAHKKKLTLILSQAQVAFHENSLDITPQVMKELDAALPSIDLSHQPE